MIRVSIKKRSLSVSPMIWPINRITVLLESIAAIMKSKFNRLAMNLTSLTLKSETYGLKAKSG